MEMEQMLADIGSYVWAEPWAGIISGVLLITVLIKVIPAKFKNFTAIAIFILFSVWVFAFPRTDLLDFFFLVILIAAVSLVGSRKKDEDGD